MYTIKEVSKMMGISAYTLRYYEKIGLLEFVKRDKNGVRQFSESDLLTLNTIYRLKDTGMPLQKIKHYLDLIDEGIDSVGERKKIMEEQKKSINHQIQKLEKALETIDAKIEYYDIAEKEHTLKVCDDDRSKLLNGILNDNSK